MFKIGLLTFLILQICHVFSQNNELISVVVLFRHGDRSPINIYPYDPYNASYWPMGLGQLTNIGKKEHYDLGVWFKERYSDFLPTRYDNEFFKVYSSNVDRCLMSAASHLAGLLPPKNDQIWNENLLWQPIPIHTTQEGKDAIVTQDYRCPKYYKLYEELMHTDDFITFFEENSDLFRIIAENSGENITTILELGYFFNTLYIEKLYNLTLPDWAENIYDNLEDVCNKSWTSMTYTTDLARLWSGPLFDYIATNFESKLNNVNDAPNYLILSAHDSTLVNFLHPLGLYDNLWPEYAASIILELSRSGMENNTFVNIFYKNSTHVKNLTLQGCDFDCDYTKFNEIITPIRLDVNSWKQECNE